MSEFEIIPKEDVHKYHFVTYDVLDTKDERAARKSELDRAMILGNSEHTKIKLFFMTAEGLKEVETTVWATTDETVTLKGGVIIPISSISKVSFI